MLKNYSKASISKLKIIWKLSLVLLYIIKLKTINYEREREREREREFMMYLPNFVRNKLQNTLPT